MTREPVHSKPTGNARHTQIMGGKKMAKGSGKEEQETSSSGGDTSGWGGSMAQPWHPSPMMEVPLGLKDACIHPRVPAPHALPSSRPAGSCLCLITSSPVSLIAPHTLFFSQVFLPSPFALPAPSQPQGTRGCCSQPRQGLRTIPPWLPPLPPQALQAISSTLQRWGLRQGKIGLENSVGSGWDLNKPNCCPLTCIAAAPHLHLGIIDSEHPAPGDTHICCHLHVSDVISTGSRDVEVALSITSIKTCLVGQEQRVKSHQ